MAPKRTISISDSESDTSTTQEEEQPKPRKGRPKTAYKSQKKTTTSSPLLEDGSEEDLKIVESSEESEKEDVNIIVSGEGEDYSSDEMELLKEMAMDKELHPTRMTQRQQARLDKVKKKELREDQEEDFDLELKEEVEETPRKKKVDAAKELERLEKARRRKQLAERKLEQDKEATLRRLLDKQATVKSKEAELKKAASKLPPTRIRYIQRVEGSVLAFPPNYHQMLAQSED